MTQSCGICGTGISIIEVNGLKLLNKKGVVLGLPKIDSFDLCEGCIYRNKQEVISNRKG